MYQKRSIVLLLGIVIILIVCTGLFWFMTREVAVQHVEIENEELLSSEIQTEKEFVIGERDAIFTEENYPRIDGSTATIPLSEAFKAEFLEYLISICS